MINGFSFIEVLISLFILSLLILLAAGMQFSALHQTESAYYLSVATEQLHSMAEHLQVTQGENRNTLQDSWNEQLQRALPNGRGTIQGNATLTVFWGNKNRPTCDRTTIGLTGCVKETVNIKGVS